MRDYIINSCTDLITDMNVTDLMGFIPLNLPTSGGEQGQKGGGKSFEMECSPGWLPSCPITEMKLLRILLNRMSQSQKLNDYFYLFIFYFTFI
jgi:hypothetical protein